MLLLPQHPSPCYQHHPAQQIKLPAASHTHQLLWGGVGTAGTLSCPTRAHQRSSSVPGPITLQLLLPELLLELPCLAWAMLHQLCLLPEHNQIQASPVIISSRKEFIWVWVRKSVLCWLPDPLSCPDLFTEMAQPAKFLTPGSRGSLSCKKNLRRRDRKRKPLWEFVPSLRDLLLTG